jgi:phage tail-like protein
MDYATAHAWGFEVDGNSYTMLTEISGVSMELDIIDEKMNNSAGLYISVRAPGRKKMGEFTVKRGFTDNKDWSKWYDDTAKGLMPDVRRGGAIVLLDHTFAELQRFVFMDAMPKKYGISGSLKAGATEGAIEELVLVHTGLTVE